MVSKSKANFIISLQKKKVRDEEKLYVIEGDKLVREFLIAKTPFVTLVARPEFLNSLPLIHKQGIGEIIPASYEELKKISSLKTPHNALAVIRMPEKRLDTNDLFKEMTIALDCIQDPGNLGTIIRAAVWFGIKNIVCSEDCVDVYNPKVIQSSMGAIIHVSVLYTNLKTFLTEAKVKNLSIYGTLLEGESIYSQKLGGMGIILLGNESKGISEDLVSFIDHKLMIPKFSDATPGIDSLNVGMAASIVFSEFARRTE